MLAMEPYPDPWLARRSDPSPRSQFCNQRRVAWQWLMTLTIRTGFGPPA